MPMTANGKVDHLDGLLPRTLEQMHEVLQQSARNATVLRFTHGYTVDLAEAVKHGFRQIPGNLQSAVVHLYIISWLGGRSLKEFERAAGGTHLAADMIVSVLDIVEVKCDLSPR